MEAMKRSGKTFDVKSGICVILVRPEHSENIGLVARNMKNTGFTHLRLVGVNELDQKTYQTAIHSQDILKSAQLCNRLEEATADFGVVFAATAKRRKNFTLLSLEDVVERLYCYPESTKVGFLFGNERTGLTSEELKHANFRFSLPQSTRQPSYNLASAVLVTLYAISARAPRKFAITQQEQPLPRKEQEECIKMILQKLEKRGFLHTTNKRHVTEMIYDIFGRLDMTERDRRLLLALFSKGLGESKELES
jgi:TrmH family RNA methyltransferase